MGDSTDALRDEYWTLNRRLGQANQEIDDARRTLSRARDDIRAAADRAIAAIETVIDRGTGPGPGADHPPLAARGRGVRAHRGLPGAGARVE